MVTLKNDRITVEIAEKGAEMRKMTLDGNDVLWSGDPTYWAGVAPVLFPLCGGLRDNKYTLGGKEYTMELKHGYARVSDFTLEKRGCNSVTFLLTDTPESREQYPFSYEFRITYSLRDTVVNVKYEVKNLSDNTMYFSIGSHEAYACPEGIEDYDIIFPQKETLNSCVLDGSLLAHETLPIIKESTTLPLYEKYFAIDALVFKNVKSRSATLRNRKTGRNLTVNFPGCDYLLLWTKPGAGYICIEPWCGIPSMVDDGYALEEKEGILTIEPNAVFTKEHNIYL
ncbi:MAG: aldose 1-epimerase family protein [Ruminococcaceae bacterium]|nr:aldose 1-epimerase family protein [Oscillospiraceae bacterium]